MIDKLDIITLGNNKSYVVVEKLIEESHEYLFLSLIDDNEELLEEKLIAEVIKTNEGYDINPIDDKDILNKICTKFLNNI